MSRASQSRVSQSRASQPRMSRASQLRQSLGRLSRSSLLGASKSLDEKEEEVLPTDPEFERHLAGEHGNKKAALKRWKKTQQWRQDYEVNGILDRPYDMFDIIKRYYPQYYAGLTKDRHLLYIERLTEVNLKKLRELGITVDDLIHHYIYVAEYQVNFLSKETVDGKTTTILDVQGLTMRQIIGETISFAKRVAKIAQEHYPERAFRIYIVHVPLWFNTVYQIIKPLLSKETQAKIRIFRSGYKKELLQEVDADVLPVKYGGKNSKADYENEFELEMREFVVGKLDKHDVKMKT